jgi:hypothetical protein
MGPVFEYAVTLDAKKTDIDSKSAKEEEVERPAAPGRPGDDKVLAREPHTASPALLREAPRQRGHVLVLCRAKTRPSGEARAAPWDWSRAAATVRPPLATAHTTHDRTRTRTHSRHTHTRHRLQW